MRIQQLRIAAVIYNRGSRRPAVMPDDLFEHPAAGRSHHGGSGEPPAYNFAILVDPTARTGFIAVDCHPPAHNITMRNHQLRDVAFNRAIIKLIEVDQVGFYFMDDAEQVIGRSLQIFLRVLHPLQLESSGAKVEIFESLHRCALTCFWNISKADQSYLNSATKELGYDLSRVGPHPTQGVGSNHYAHSKSSIAAGCCS